MSTPSKYLNSKLRGKKIDISNHDKDLIAATLSLIWQKINQKIEFCLFEDNTVKVSYKKHEGCVYFDLNNNQKSLSSFTERLESKV